MAISSMINFTGHINSKLLTIYKHIDNANLKAHLAIYLLRILQLEAVTA